MKKILCLALLVTAGTITAFGAAPGENESSRLSLTGGALPDSEEEWVWDDKDKALRPVIQPPSESKEKEKDEAGDTQGTASISPETPLYISADYMKYSDSTGDVSAKGNVDARHVLDRYQTEYLYGNTLTGKYIAPGEITWKGPTTELKAARADYDAKAGIAHFEDLTGWEQGVYYYQGASGVYDRDSNHVLVDQGYFTTRHAMAKVPDYRIEADQIDIYPNDRYEAKNLRLLAKNTTLITLSSYTGSLRKDTGKVQLWTLIPRPTYDSDDGAGLHNSIVVPIARNPNTYVYLDNRLYSKVGYKPDIGAVWVNPVGTITLHHGQERSTTNDEDDSVWIKKQPSLELATRRFPIGGGVYLAGKADIGRWDESYDARSVKATHIGYDMYLARDPVKLSPHLSFDWRIGYMKDYYKNLSIDGVKQEDRTRNNWYYALGLTGSYRAFSGWIHYTDRNLSRDRTPFFYDTYTTESPLTTGFKVQITPKDAVSVSWTIDTVDGDLTHRYYTYYRDLHSFYSWISYDTVEKKTRIMLAPKDFSF